MASSQIRVEMRAAELPARDVTFTTTERQFCRAANTTATINGYVRRVEGRNFQ